MNYDGILFSDLTFVASNIAKVLFLPFGITLLWHVSTAMRRCEVIK